MIFNLMMGIAGLLLAGDSLGQCARKPSFKFFVLWMAEVLVGMYFITAAIGS